MNANVNDFILDEKTSENETPSVKIKQEFDL